MTALPHSFLRVSPEQYLAGEQDAPLKHEYVDGVVYVMAGASDTHNIIAGNLFASLHSQLRGKRCRPFIADMKVKVPPSYMDAFYYPDVFVTCGEGEAHAYCREAPVVIFEVISPSTERVDRQEKSLAYAQIPSMSVYVLVEQESAAVTIRRRSAEGWKEERQAGLERAIELPEIECRLALADLYELVSLPSGVPPEGAS